MQEPGIVVRRGGCTFCCLPLVLMLGFVGAGLAGVGWLLVSLLLR